MAAIAAEAVNHRGALHNEAELAAVLSILTVAEPKVVLEIGTWAGGSAWAWSQIRSVRHIVTVDLDPRPEAAMVLESLLCRADQVIGDSGHPYTLAEVARLLDGYRPDVLVIDGGHMYPTARRDWDAYLLMMGSGGLVVLHDTQGYPGNDTVEVPQLWAEVRGLSRSAEIIATPGGPGGTGILWV